MRHFVLQTPPSSSSERGGLLVCAESYRLCPDCGRLMSRWMPSDTSRLEKDFDTNGTPGIPALGATARPHGRLNKWQFWIFGFHDDNISDVQPEPQRPSYYATTEAVHVGTIKVANDINVAGPVMLMNLLKVGPVTASTLHDHNLCKYRKSCWQYCSKCANCHTTRLCAS